LVDKVEIDNVVFVDDKDFDLSLSTICSLFFVSLNKN